MNIFLKNEIINFIDNYETELNDKRQRGSVFTKSKLIIKMINKLPSNVWKNPKLKWLDSGSGIGSFFIIVFFKLMENIPIKNEEERRKHILENMLYFVELDLKYIELLKTIFCSDKYKLNIFHGSYVNLNTLDSNVKIFNNEIFNIKFNIILGNPPYQKINMKDTTKLSAKPLYPFFVEKSLEHLQEDGYLLYIHPISWRRKSKEIKIIKEILNKRLIYIYTNNKFPDFGISAPFINYYLLQNKEYDKNHLTNYETIFNDKIFIGKIHLEKDLEFIPSFLTKETIKIFDKIINKSGEKFDVQQEAKLSTTKKNISTLKDNNFIHLNYHGFSIKNGNIYRYSCIKHPSSNKSKIIFTFKGGYKYLNPFFDEGIMGITDACMRLIINDKNKELLLNFFNSDLLKFLLMSTTYNYGSNQKNEFHIINMFTIPEIYNFYKFYNLKPNEIKFINENLK